METRVLAERRAVGGLGLGSRVLGFEDGPEVSE